ncbi:LD-carboxypeptidase [Spongiactinospora sp. TRM90649]|uniref:S66 peptidase family protein n=1 Tax=Spongiactinospora sp. TRM90649 TaxID=3031114 RepID=UPI0023F83DA9|nr:LD-carboxypeptidase [Spongiactinospora sp. TRM90649]MDF5753754.1 LD-carboxypeptidase [Spongiactinospora sp. TRM90649]
MAYRGGEDGTGEAGTGPPPLLSPPPLHQGDTVAVVAPSGPPDPARLERGAGVLRELGLKVVFGEHVLARGDGPPSGHHGHLAASDADRAGDLQEAWCDPAVAAVVCARGGYGTTRLLGLLDWDRMAGAGPKTLLGSSDITALHLAIGARLGTAGCFGPMPAGETLAGDLGPEPLGLRHLEQALYGVPGPITGTHALVPGRVSAPLAGGNLTLLAALCGTPFAPRFAGRIVLLEDVQEAPYRIDRMLTQLIAAGAFDGAAGFALGSWVGCGDVLPVLAERLTPYGVPVLAGLAVGHGSPQHCVWLGGLGVIDTQSCSLTSLFRGSEEAM